MTISVKAIVIALLALVALLAAAAGAVIGLAIFFEYPGGMASSYRAVDHDRRLTPIARSAAPIIAAIDHFYAANGRCPHVNESDLSQLHADLPPDLAGTLQGRAIEFRPPGAVSGWLYYASNTDPSSCALSYKLGWDPALEWSRHGARTTWTFVPGDGSDDRTIVLDIGP
jgi:hypothetical protein